jgi:hypothetical protein
MGGIGGFGGNRGATGIGSHLQSAGLGKSFLNYSKITSLLGDDLKIIN